MSQTSNRLLLGIGLAGLILDGISSHPALADDKVALFRVVDCAWHHAIGAPKSQDALASSVLLSR